MSNYHLYIRKNNGICERVAISPHSTVQELKHQISILTNTQISLIQLTLKGYKLELDLIQTLESSSIPNGAILEVAPLSTQSHAQIDICLEYYNNRVMRKINENSNIALLRQMASQFFSIQASRLQFQLKGNKIFNDDVLIKDLELDEGEIIKVKDKKMITNLFGQNEDEQPKLVDSGNRIKVVESIASSQQTPEEYIGVNERSFRKEYQSQIVKKKSSYHQTSSLKKIDEQNQLGFIKRSAIVSKNMCSQFLNSPATFRQNKLTNLNQIKEAMSFGSLEDQDICKEQTQIQVYDEFGTKYYKLLCMPDCQGWQIRQKIAKLQRVSINEIQMEIDEKVNIGELTQHFNSTIQNGNGLTQLIFKILS